MANNKIEQKILSTKVVKPEDALKSQEFFLPIVRPEVLTGSTYKIKPNGGHALYITINNDENGQPYEIFLNSKDMEQFQWIIGLMITISTVMKVPNSLPDLIEKLKGVHTPTGGYWGKLLDGKKSINFPSVVAHIGFILEEHLKLSKN